MNWNRTKALGLLAAALCTAMPLHQPVSLWQCVQAEESLRSQLNMLSYSVTNSKGETVQKWHPGETRDVRVILKNAGLKTSAVVPADQLKTGEKISCIDVDLVYCGFSTEKTPEVVLLSSAGQPLKFEVIFRDVKWKGESDSFAYTVGYSETSLPYDKETIGISQVVLPSRNPIRRLLRTRRISRIRLLNPMRRNSRMTEETAGTEGGPMTGAAIRMTVPRPRPSVQLHPTLSFRNIPMAATRWKPAKPLIWTSSFTTPPRN